MKLVLASKNPGKLRELQEILGSLGVEVLLESQVGLDLEVEETGTTFEENAFLKADAVMKASGLPAIADDSGLVVDALDGAPGVYSARFGGKESDAARTALLLEKLEGVPAEKRTARFVSAIACQRGVARAWSPTRPGDRGASATIRFFWFRRWARPLQSFRRRKKTKFPTEARRFGRLRRNFERRWSHADQ